MAAQNEEKLSRYAREELKHHQEYYAMFVVVWPALLAGLYFAAQNYCASHDWIAWLVGVPAISIVMWWIGVNPSEYAFKKRVIMCDNRADARRAGKLKEVFEALQSAPDGGAVRARDEIIEARGGWIPEFFWRDGASLHATMHNSYELRGSIIENQDASYTFLCRDDDWRPLRLFIPSKAASLELFRTIIHDRGQVARGTHTAAVLEDFFGWAEQQIFSPSNAAFIDRLSLATKASSPEWKGKTPRVIVRGIKLPNSQVLVSSLTMQDGREAVFIPTAFYDKIVEELARWTGRSPCYDIEKIVLMRVPAVL